MKRLIKKEDGIFAIQVKNLDEVAEKLYQFEELMQELHKELNIDTIEDLKLKLGYCDKAEFLQKIADVYLKQNDKLLQENRQLKIQVQAVRKQVCDEIKEKIKYKGDHIYEVMSDLLDQIEKGE